MSIEDLKNVAPIRRWRGYRSDPVVFPIDYLVWGGKWYTVSEYGISQDYYAERDTSATYEEAYQKMLNEAIADLDMAMTEMRHAQEAVDAIRALSPTPPPNI